MNIGYVISIVTRKLVGIIGMSDTHFVYCSDDEALNFYIELILKRRDVVGPYGKLDDNTVYYELINLKRKDFLSGLDFLLPWPYWINKVEYKNIEYDKIPQFYSEIKSNQSDKPSEFSKFSRSSSSNEVSESSRSNESNIFDTSSKLSSGSDNVDTLTEKSK